MCGCKEDEEGWQPGRQVELRPRVRRGIQEPEILEELGYFAIAAGIMPDPSDPAGRNIQYFTINRFHPNPDYPQIAIIGANEEKGLLVVKEIFLNRDDRDRGQRPLAAAVFLSFWHHVRGQPVESLRTIFFENATENTLMGTRDGIYESMRMDRMEPLTLSHRGHSSAEKRFFEDVYNHTPFGKCGRTIVTQNREMERARIHLSRFKFIPKGPSGFYFDFSFTFKGPSANQSHNRGNRGRR
ncbi:hypothetical protein DHEL01_v212487 [Diaporthe helianthi]|uniref:Uncharacterized protein n=1 Tax=Diaporthe helianthi TaxID=158607 RepID=A0A2P5HFU3_DIAHE|nr:hypothetical protein DHEL01_v212487 [Diaporthe helianthi]